jgi:hypothetical protein
MQQDWDVPITLSIRKLEKTYPISILNITHGLSQKGIYMSNFHFFPWGLTRPYKRGSAEWKIMKMA